MDGLGIAGGFEGGGTVLVEFRGGRKLGVVTLMTGQGSWADPQRPMLPATGALNYRWVASDDGQWTIVEVDLARVPA